MNVDRQHKLEQVLLAAIRVIDAFRTGRITGVVSLGDKSPEGANALIALDQLLQDPGK